jgi:2-polyprenyl-6-methoxyphenol hydroxylase-like FAD-dependent oxidoreductase
MNMGIEDACALARRIADGTTTGYTAERRPVAHKSRLMTERILAMAETTNPAVGAIRNTVLSVITHSRWLQRFLLGQMLG